MTQHMAGTVRLEAQRNVIHFCGPINPITVHSIKGTMLQALNSHKSNPAIAPVSDFYFVFCSEGGDVNSGISLFNFLRAVPVPLIMHNFGCVDSIAILVYMAADTRYVTDNGRFFFHGFTSTFIQPIAAFSSHDFSIAERSCSVMNHMETYRKCIVERIDNSKSVIDFEAAFREGCVVGSSEAIANGIAHKIVSPDNFISENDVHLGVTP